MLQQLCTFLVETLYKLVTGVSRRMRVSRIYAFFCLILIASSFFFKLIWWDDPFGGLKYDRQITTLDTIEAYARLGIDFFRPERYWTSAWEHFYVLEVSIYQALSAWVSGFTNTVISAARGTNLFFALLTLPVIFQIAIKYFCRKHSVVFLTNKSFKSKYSFVEIFK